MERPSYIPAEIQHNVTRKDSTANYKSSGNTATDYNVKTTS